MRRGLPAQSVLLISGTRKKRELISARWAAIRSVNLLGALCTNPPPRTEMNRVLFASVFLSGLAGMVVSATAAQSYSTPGSVYSQNFNSLTTPNNSSVTPETGAWTDNSTLPGWYYLRDNGVAAQTYTMADGHAPAQGRMLSMGSDGSTDRALGTQNSNVANVNNRFGLQLSNATGLTLGSFSLGYTGEEWRVIGGEPADSLSLNTRSFPPAPAAWMRRRDGPPSRRSLSRRRSRGRAV